MSYPAGQSRLTRNEIIAALSGCSFIRARNLVIDVTSYVDCQTYRDVIELYLAVSGVREWHWSDPSGGIEPRQPLSEAVRHLCSDVVRWLPIYLSQGRRVKQLVRDCPSHIKAAPAREVLFLRTDHWFRLKSGGSIGHVKGIVSGLRQLGLKTTVVSSDSLAGLEPDQDFHLVRPKYLSGRNLPNIPELLYNDQVLLATDALGLDWKSRFIYQRYSLGNYSGVLLKRQQRVPLVCEYNGSEIWVSEHWGRALFHRRLMESVELLNLKCADLIVVVSEALRQSLLARGIPDNKILVNPNGVDTDLYSPFTSGTEIRERFGLRNKVVIGFIGTFGPWHGAEVLAEAFGKLLQRFPAYRDSIALMMVGDGAARGRVTERLEQMGATPFTVMTGSVDQSDGPKYLAAFDVCVSPHVPNPDGSPFFGSPTKLFEYMAMGKAILASDLDQIAEVLHHNQTGWLTPAGDLDSLVNGLKRLIDDSSLRNRLGAAARQQAVDKHTWKHHTTRILDALLRLTAQ